MLQFSAYLASLLVLVAVARDIYRKRSSGLPPGPPTLPFLGNALQLPSQFLWYKLADWAKVYGSIYTIWMMGKPFVVLNSVGAAADVLDRMSGTTGGRVQLLKAEFYHMDSMVFNSDPSPRWRAARKAMHSNLNVQTASRFNSLLQQDVAYFTLGLLQHPKKPFHEHAHRLAGSIIFRTLYGGAIFPHVGEDPSHYMDEIHKEALHAISPGRSIVDMFPFLAPLIRNVKWLRRYGDDWYTKTNKEGYRLYNSAAAAQSWEPLVNDFNANMEKYGLVKQDAVWVTLVIYMAGQETTSTALRYLVLALLHYPDAMTAAQDELDRVCGDRLPSFEDRRSLPYIDALIKEVIRWRPSVPLSLLHKALEDCEYQGFNIPKGTGIIDNIWAQTRDTSVYVDPETFDPTRFLDASGQLLPVTPDTRLDLLGFGHGRRVCPGRDFASNSLFITCAYLLWAFRIEWPVDENGLPLVCGTKDIEDRSFVAIPRPFDVVMWPRHPDLESKLMAVIKI